MEKIEERYKLNGFDNFSIELTEDDGVASGAPVVGGGFATLSSVPGMGQPIYATSTTAGSGDVPSPSVSIKKKKRVKNFIEFIDHNK